MNSRTDFQTGFCPEYEVLLHKCEDSRQACAQWRSEMNSANSIPPINKEVADELLRLQAKYAKAYARLEGHYKQCDRCQFVGRRSAEQSNYTNLSTGTEQSRPA